jgi:hypothetical protein
MKKIVTSAGIIALGAASLHAAYAPGLSPLERQKPWSVALSVRGFYDDNYNTAPSKRPPGGIPEDSSFGIEASPSAALNLSLDQTYIGLSYVYSMKYYEGRPDEEIDHSHQFNAKLDHTFSPRFNTQISDSLVIAQEPEIIDPSIVSTPIRSEGDNLRNTAIAEFNAKATDKLGFNVGYQNTLYDYEQDASSIISDPILGPANPFGVNSRSALLDRMEHLAHLNTRWDLLPSTVGIVGYQYGWVEYTADASDPLFDPVTATIVSNDLRDNRSHYGYIGADHSFNTQLNASVRIGVQHTEFSELDQSATGPYADAALTYAYAKESRLQVGLRHQRNQTDVFLGGGNFTTDAESTSVYASLAHKLTAKITANLLGQFQNSTFRGGSVDDSSEQFYTVGLNLAYTINQYLMAEAGYNYDRLESDIDFRGFDRNRVYIGLRATY